MWRRLLCSWQGAVSPDEDSGDEKPVDKASDPASAVMKGGMTAKGGGSEARQPQAATPPAAGSPRRASSSRAAGDAPPEERRVPPLDEALVLLAEARRAPLSLSLSLSLFSSGVSRARCLAHAMFLTRGSPPRAVPRAARAVGEEPPGAR